MWHLPTLPPRLQMSGDRSSTAYFPAQKQPLLRARFLVQHFRILQGMQYLQIHCSCSLSPAAGGILPQQLSVQWGTCSWDVWKQHKKLHCYWNIPPNCLPWPLLCTQRQSTWVCAGCRLWNTLCPLKCSLSAVQPLHLGCALRPQVGQLNTPEASIAAFLSYAC